MLTTFVAVNRHFCSYLTLVAPTTCRSLLKSSMNSIPSTWRSLNPRSLQSSTTIGIRQGPIAPATAFITGGARGLGNAVAQSFANNGACGVVIVDIQGLDTLQERKCTVEQYGTKGLATQADVTEEDEIERVVNDAVTEFEHIDYAANFAGIVVSLNETV